MPDHRETFKYGCKGRNDHEWFMTRGQAQVDFVNDMIKVLDGDKGTMADGSTQSEELVQMGSIAGYSMLAMTATLSFLV